MEEIHEQGISRRKVLKRMGAGVAVAWTAPVLTSLGSPAFAQTPTCEAFSCLVQQACGGAGCPQPDPCAFCALLDDGSCVCWNLGFCSNPPCQSDADCEAQGIPGGRCGPINADCQCGAEAKACFVPCGVQAPSRLPRGAKRLGRS